MVDYIEKQSNLTSVQVVNDPVVVTLDTCANLSDSHHPKCLKIWLTLDTYPGI